MSKPTVAYFHDPEVSNYHYGPSHPMKPHRLALTHSLISQYDLLKKMKVYEPRMATEAEIKAFHSEEYVEFLKSVTPYTHLNDKIEFGLYGDCPGFHALYEFCQRYTGASMDAAVKLNTQEADICINWSGGLHHARKSDAAGFCYVNDIVLAIQELLKFHARVLYIDIDIHHGDGVQDAFYFSDRVMCVSFHKHGDNFFPGTGGSEEIGYGRGKMYSLNVPLRDGIEDSQYQHLFEPVMREVIAKFRPNAIVLQCGADSVRDDRIGAFNLSLKGHAKCVEYIKGYNLPLLVLGGGGYTIKNVARCWANETATLTDTVISNDIPFNEYFEHYAPLYQMHNSDKVKMQSKIPNSNTSSSLQTTLSTALEQLRHLDCAPSVQMSYVPDSFFMDDVVALFEKEKEMETNVDYREKSDKVANPAELYSDGMDVDHD